MSPKIGILGGTFNPIHFGHLAAAEEVRSRLGLEKVLFIPSFLPPHKQEGDIPTALQRLEMVRLAIAGNPAFECSDLEVRRGGKSFTIDTIEELLRLRPGGEWYFITGLDSFLEINTWKDWKRLLTLCRFVVIAREGRRFSDLAGLELFAGSGKELAALDARRIDSAVVRSGAATVHLEMIPFYEISSTDIRARRKSGRSIKYHLPEPVERYIIEHKLYE